MNYLITGGAGYFGQAMARHLLAQPDTHKVCIFSRNEANQAKMREEFDHGALRFFIGDVRDMPRLYRAMQGIDIVIHAAALKRVEVGEYNPSEMVKTNVIGTMNVIDAAQKACVAQLVVLSSDKACAPLNAYGATKLTAEKLALAAAVEYPEGPLITVTRYGNVAGSTGSIIPNWRAAIKAGQKITVTDLEATRFWMSVEEACDLVTMAATGQYPGCIIVPSLPAYEVGYLMQAMLPRAWELTITGLRPGEKMHEEMISAQEAQGFSRLHGYWIKGQDHGERRQEALSSDKALRLTVQEIRNRLEQVK